MALILLAVRVRIIAPSRADLTFEESTFDNEGRRLTSRDRGGRTTSYEYDSVGRLKKTTYPDLSFTQNTYDAAGRLTATTDARGKTTTYGYDSGGRRTNLRDPLGNETVFTYDPNGNQQNVRDARLNTTTFAYDDLNRRTRTTFPDGTYTETTYDVLGRRTAERDQAGRVTEFRYDKVGRLTRVIDATGHETTYGYDELGNRTRQTDANNHATLFEYDRLGRETARILPDGAREGKQYDAAGNLEARTDFMGRVTTYSYDANNRLTSRSYPNPSENVGFTYTATGRREVVTDGRGTTSYGYDLRDRLTSLIQPGVGSLGFGYDGNGNRTALTATVAGNDHATTYSHDDAGRLDVVTDPASRAYDFGHDPNGNRSSLQYPNGTSTAYTYDALNRLTNLTTTGPLGTVQGYAFTLGAAGNRTRIDEADGTVREYGYDALYRLTSETVRDGLTTLYSKTFAYDFVGNRESQTTTGGGGAGLPDPGNISYTYDTRDRLLTDSTSYGYDTNGNLTSKTGEATYVWDHENRLIRVEKADGTVIETQYDADGNRVSTTTTPAAGSPTTTHYLVDTAGGLSHAVAEVDASNNLTALYVRGSDELLSVMRPAGAGTWTTRFFHPDGIGSVRRLTDEGGGITDGYSFEAFGTELAHTGSDPQPYRFAGEPYDPNVGFQYHRARWMDPRVGRFVRVDPLLGRAFEPVSLHRYLYAATDPANRIDPTGRDFSVVGNLAAVQIATTIIGIQATIGLAVIDQIQYGGDAGLRALAIGAVVTLGLGIAIRVAGIALRRVPLALPAAKGAAVKIPAGALRPHEIAQAERIVQWRGGTFLGPPTADFRGIDGWIEGIAASLKRASDVNGIKNVIDDGAEQATRAGHAGAELFIDARQVRGAAILDANNVARHADGVLRDGSFSAINVETADGWSRIVP